MPLMGVLVQGHQMFTISSLIEEFSANPRLLAAYPWVAKAPKVDDLRLGMLQLSAAENRKVDAKKKELRPYVDMAVNNYRKRNIAISRLSNADLTLLATAVVLGAVIATDERALQLIVQDLMGDPDEYPVGVVCSLDVLAMFERANMLTKEQRTTTVDTWLRLGERLPMTWRADYLRNFNEEYG